MISNPTDKKKVKDKLFEISGSMDRIAAERDLIKTVIADLADEFELDKKQVRRMAKVYHKQSFNSEVEQDETFQELYENIVGVE